jgi:flavin reductase (DIM6/NTAB) family NADH-FMN oxidoreductase RutF
MALAAPAHPAPAPDPRSFRDALARFATGVAFVTAAPGGEPAGLIVNSLASVSLEPPLVSFSPARSSLTWTRMRRAGRFGVNVLGRQHERFAQRATPPGAISRALARRVAAATPPVTVHQDVRLQLLRARAAAS